MAYEKGDIVLVPFPVRDRAATKVRPALVVTGKAYNAKGNLIVAAITTHPPRDTSDHPLAGWKQARLVAPSSVRTQLATIATSRVLHRPGRIPQPDLHEVENALRRAFER